MAFFSLEHARLAGAATVVPITEQTAESLYDAFGEKQIRKFVDYTGIRSRRIGADTGTLPSDTCFAAARRLLEQLAISPAEIDGLLFLSGQRDYEQPNTANVLQHRLGLKEDAICMDLPQGCTAAIVGLYVGGMMIQTGLKRVLVLAGSGSRKSYDGRDQKIPLLMGDAGTAFLLEYTEKPTVFRGLIKNFGDAFRMQISPYGQYRHPALKVADDLGAEELLRREGKFYMDGMETMRFTLGTAAETSREALKLFSRHADEYDTVAIHQANLSIVKGEIRKLDVAPEKVPLPLIRFANTGPATIGMCLSDRYGESRDKESKLVFMNGFGVGLSAGAMETEVIPDSILPITETDLHFEDGVTYEEFD